MVKNHGKNRGCDDNEKCGPSAPAPKAYNNRGRCNTCGQPPDSCECATKSTQVQSSPAPCDSCGRGQNGKNNKCPINSKQRAEPYSSNRQGQGGRTNEGDCELATGALAQTNNRGKAPKCSTVQTQTHQTLLPQKDQNDKCNIKHNAFAQADGCEAPRRGSLEKDHRASRPSGQKTESTQVQADFNEEPPPPPSFHSSKKEKTGRLSDPENGRKQYKTEGTCTVQCSTSPEEQQQQQQQQKQQQQQQQPTTCNGPKCTKENKCERFAQQEHPLMLRYRAILVDARPTILQMSEARIPSKPAVAPQKKSIPAPRATLPLPRHSTPPSRPTSSVPPPHQESQCSSVSSDPIEQAFQKLIRDKNVAVLWIIGYTQQDVVNHKARCLSKLTTSNHLAVLDLELELQNWHSNPKRFTAEPQELPDRILYRGKRLAQKVISQHAPLTLSEIIQAYKLAMLTLKEKDRSIRGFFLDGFPVNIHEGDESELNLIKSLVSLYFLSKAWTTDKSVLPKVIKPQYDWRGGRSYSEVDAEATADYFGYKTIKILNAEELEDIQIKDIDTLVKKHLEGHGLELHKIAKHIHKPHETNPNGTSETVTEFASKVVVDHRNFQEDKVLIGSEAPLFPSSSGGGRRNSAGAENASKPSATIPASTTQHSTHRDSASRPRHSQVGRSSLEEDINLGGELAGEAPPAPKHSRRSHAKSHAKSHGKSQGKSNPSAASSYYYGSTEDGEEEPVAPDASKVVGNPEEKKP